MAKKVEIDPKIQLENGAIRKLRSDEKLEVNEAGVLTIRRVRRKKSASKPKATKKAAPKRAKKATRKEEPKKELPVVVAQEKQDPFAEFRMKKDGRPQWKEGSDPSGEEKNFCRNIGAVQVSGENAFNDDGTYGECAEEREYDKNRKKKFSLLPSRPPVIMTEVTCRICQRKERINQAFASPTYRCSKCCKGER